MRRWGSLIRKGPRCKSRALQVCAWRWGFRYSSSENEPSSAKSETPNETDSKGEAVTTSQIELVKQAYSSWAETNKMTPYDDFLVGAKQAYHALGHLFHQHASSGTSSLRDTMQKFGLGFALSPKLALLVEKGLPTHNVLKLAHSKDHILAARMTGFAVEFSSDEMGEKAGIVKAGELVLPSIEQSIPKASVTVEFIVVTPPQRFCPGFNFFNERLKNVDNEFEKVAVAKILGSAGGLGILSVIDRIVYQITGKKLEFFVTEGVYAILHLPPDYGKHPPSRRKFMRFQLSDGSNWVIDEIRIDDDVFSSTEYA